MGGTEGAASSSQASRRRRRCPRAGGKTLNAGLWILTYFQQTDTEILEEAANAANAANVCLKPP